MLRRFHCGREVQLRQQSLLKGWATEMNKDIILTAIISPNHQREATTGTAERPMSLLNSGSKISRLSLGTLVVIKAGIPCVANWRGGNTSILDKVCFSCSNLLMPLSALQSLRGSVAQQAVKTFFRLLLNHLSHLSPPLNQRESRSLNFALLGARLVLCFSGMLPWCQCVCWQDLIFDSTWCNRRREEVLFLRNNSHPERQLGR